MLLLQMLSTSETCLSHITLCTSPYSGNFPRQQARLLDYICLQGEDTKETIPPEKIRCCPPPCGEYSAVHEAENNEKHMAGLVYPW